ncbi:sensor histidine kinase [Nonomuraea rubra]|uniref:Signal transduction histidine kinase n=1 Tax=Nonomuraea rubra TaxID=46180 RepID=A0A7X0NNM1_9ACTN|nr:ATP-binding protein [Nonomuraea rubra]MBB6546762.1 signal transduction histidine kinase [Nonomuraea rubra]
MSSRLVAGPLALIAAGGVVAGPLLETGLPAPPQQWVFIVLVLPLPVLGWLLAVRRPELRYGWLLLAAALALGLSVFGTGLSARGEAHVVTTALGSLGAVFYGLTWIFVPLLFPDGRLPSRRWRPVAWISGGAIALHAGGILVLGYNPYHPPSGPPSATELAGALAGAAGQFVTWIMAVIVFCGLVVRWRRSGRAERGQYAWMVGGMVATAAGAVLLSLFQFGGPQYGAAGVVGLLAVVGSLPAAIGVAVVRHRLLDVRVGLRGSRLHLVFDLRPTVDEVLSDLGTALEDTPEPVEQLARLAAAVRTGLDLRWAAVTLADGTRVVSGEQQGPAVLELPVRGGRIECGPRDTGPLTRVDRRLLEALAVPAGLAIQSAGLVTRLVNAQEAERRRIERNIHDGVQQQLVALIAGLELARATGAGPAVLAGLREQARQTLADLRELAAGIHPSALSQGGLVEAVEERCSRLPVRTTVTSPPSLRARRFADQVEGAMYFTVSEAVANALKHAAAATIEVRLEQDGGRLRATVADDGKGFDPGAPARRGLATLADRLDALGGSLTVDSEPGKGTRVNAWVPVDG